MSLQEYLEFLPKFFSYLLPFASSNFGIKGKLTQRWHHICFIQCISFQKQRASIFLIKSEGFFNALKLY